MTRGMSHAVWYMSTIDIGSAARRDSWLVVEGKGPRLQKAAEEEEE